MTAPIDTASRPSPSPSPAEAPSFSPSASVSVSATRMAMLSRCGAQFERRYVMGEILPPAVAMIVGSAVDHSVTVNLRTKMAEGSLLSLEHVADLARDECSSRWQSGDVALSEDEAAAGAVKTHGEAVDKSVRLATLHARELAPAIEPTHVQRGFEVELPDADARLTGYLDVQEGATAIRDTKTARRSPQVGAAHTSLQLGVYALAAQVLDGALPARVQLDYLVDSRKPQAVSLTSTRDDAAIAMVLARINRFVETVRAGQFVPTDPDSWVCSRQFCGYADSCPYFSRPVSVAVAQGGN